jgi:hypothetical protein
MNAGLIERKPAKTQQPSTWPTGRFPLVAANTHLPRTLGNRGITCALADGPVEA